MSDLLTARINSRRLWDSLMRMAEIGRTDKGGCNRQALTDEDRRGRDLFVSWARDAGCTVSVDQIGNIFAARAGADSSAAPVWIGSHLDTQPTGGRFDGVYGVMAGLEVVRTLNDMGCKTRRPIEIVSWTNEEGCRFAPAMLGSGVVSGAYALEYAYSRVDKSGVTLGQELARIGYKGERSATSRVCRAVFEAHIEQGPILEAAGTTIGAVQGIQGACWLDVTLKGVAAHAGPTPMEMRRDPWRVAAPLIQHAFDIAARNAPWGRATIGNLKVTPGSRNTVPEQLIVSVDLRHPERATLDAMVMDLRESARALAAEHRVGVEIENVWTMPPTRFDPQLVSLIGRCATELGYSTRTMISGAGHDSLHTAQFAPTAMIFVPCAGGLSHNEEESAKAEDLAAGANVLLHSVLNATND
jgi:N-carbamoyl-L-amino-acid hydrolase